MPSFPSTVAARVLFWTSALLILCCGAVLGFEPARSTIGETSFAIVWVSVGLAASALCAMRAYVAKRERLA